MNEKFKEYTEKGFEFEIFSLQSHALYVTVSKFAGGSDWHCDEVYRGDNLDHAFAACELWMEGVE